MAEVMSEKYEVLLPKLGESIVSATVVHWLKKVGDPVEKDEPLLEVMTDKVNSEIPSPHQGVLQDIKAKVDEEIEVGQLLCIIGNKIEKIEKSANLSPAVKELAKEHQISDAELQSIPGSGEEGRVCKKDVENYLAKATKDRTESLSPLRKAIAKELTLSQNVPTATLIDEINITDLMRWIIKEKEVFLQLHQAKLTITSCMALATAKALVDLPLLNATLEGDKVTLHKDVHVGMAVSVENGVLVPVISACQLRCLPGVAREISKISGQVRDGTWKGGNHEPAGTVTITNFGMGKVPIGIPMIIPGQAAILGIGAIQKKILIDDEDRMSIGQTLFVSLTFDHRLVDGMYASKFFQSLRGHLDGCKRYI